MAAVLLSNGHPLFHLCSRMMETYNTEAWISHPPQFSGKGFGLRFFSFFFFFCFLISVHPNTGLLLVLQFEISHGRTSKPAVMFHSFLTNLGSKDRGDSACQLAAPKWPISSLSLSFSVSLSLDKKGLKKGIRGRSFQRTVSEQVLCPWATMDFLLFFPLHFFSPVCIHI